ncbi:hypothetical protein F5050DRAFT_1154054 [Lentinula boryana]|uniref:Uncharacterized protein n=1 Tax=Lentinula boryana TaxID=40481 RepID=A0ABQ8QK27_9AGAR|nr:hypothetical protein F5050DRAFT_1154054 [Lentinula boryana]
MPSLNLLSRLYRKKTTILAGDGSSSATTRVTPEPRASQNENALSRTSLSFPLERRIHPDLNALAAELSSDIHDPRHSNEDSPLPRAIPSQTVVNIPSVSLTPWIRDRHNIPSATQTTNITTHETPTESAPEPTSSDKSIHASPQGNVSPTPSNERPESRANRIFNRITGLGVRASPTPNPPSAWNTFGRRRSRRHNPIPHASDFGASPDVSLSNSQRSRASSNQTSPWYTTENSADTSGSLSMSLQSISQSHSRSQSQSNSFHTPSHVQHRHSPPSSAFTFGRVGPLYGQIPPSALPAYPALRFSLFGGEAEEVPDWPNSREGKEMHGDTNPDLNLQPLQPRTSASMPSLSQHRTFDLGSHNSIKIGTGSSRPRAQHIFPASSSLDQLSTKARRRTTTRSSGTGSSHGSRRRRNVRRNLREDSSAEVPGLSETCADNIICRSTPTTLPLLLPRTIHCIHTSNACPPAEQLLPHEERLLIPVDAKMTK